MPLDRPKVYAIDGIVPVVHPTAFVHPLAALIGDVIVGAGCYVGPCASLRGDFGRLVMEAGSNLQDCCVVHGFPHADTVIGPDGHIGHGAILHGCVIGANALIGMNSVIMDGARIGAECLVAANSFVKAGADIPPRSLVAGTPATVLRRITDEEVAWKGTGTRAYQELTRRSLASMEAVDPLAEIEPDRKRVQMPEGAAVPLYLARKDGG